MHRAIAWGAVLFKQHLRVPTPQMLRFAKQSVWGGPLRSWDGGQRKPLASREYAPLRLRDPLEETAKEIAAKWYAWIQEANQECSVFSRLAECCLHSDLQREQHAALLQPSEQTTNKSKWQCKNFTDQMNGAAEKPPWLVPDFVYGVASCSTTPGSVVVWCSTTVGSVIASSSSTASGSRSMAVRCSMTCGRA